MKARGPVPRPIRALSLVAAALLVAPMLAGAQPALAAEITALTSDKVVHAAAFAGLALLFWVAGGRRAAPAFALALAIGLAHEAIQGFMPDRQPSLADLLADAFGAAAMLAALQVKTGDGLFFPYGGTSGSAIREKESVPITQGG